MKYKKIGDILILDNNYSGNDFEELSKKHNVKTIMKINHIQGTKREPVYKILYGSETETINKEIPLNKKVYLIIVQWLSSGSMRFNTMFKTNAIIIIAANT